MRIHVVAIGQRMPSWVQEAVKEYTKRMPAHCRVETKELPAQHRGKNADLNRILETEGTNLLKAVPKDSFIIALDRVGKQIDTQNLAVHLREWMSEGRDAAFLIGGPEGISKKALDKCNAIWSLSALTFAHPLVRVVLAEQVYRAWAITENHPYHR